MEPMARGPVAGGAEGRPLRARGASHQRVVRGSTRGGPHAATPSAADSARVRASRGLECSDDGERCVRLPEPNHVFYIHRVRTTTASRGRRHARRLVFTGNRQLEIGRVPRTPPGPARFVLGDQASGMWRERSKSIARPAPRTPPSASAGSGKQVIAGTEPCGCHRGGGARGQRDRARRVGTAGENTIHRLRALQATCRVGGRSSARADHVFGSPATAPTRAT